tara:strand:- start:19199 stop:19987 length:789 start_codon:yes stop_codon:yes gene_type:complete
MTPRRIIIHAGFHKTGTTNLQQTLRANRAALRPDVRLVLRPGMNALCESARGYSKTREDYDLGLVKYEAAMLMEALERETAPTLVISSEDLSGHMPGRHGLRSYGAAPDLMRALSVAFKAVDPKAQVTFFFTTRDADPWLRSCYAQHLRTARMIWDEAEYIKRLKASAALEQIIDQIRSEVPDSDVLSAALEAHANRPLGMAEALLDILEFSQSRRAKLVPSPTRNAALTADVCAELLALNRSDLEPAALKKAKRAVIDGAV